MTQKQFEIFKQVLIDYTDAENQYWENLSQGPAQVSDELLQRLLQIPYQSKKQKALIVSTRHQKLIAIVAIISALLIALTLSVSAIRETFFNFIEEIYDSYVSIFVTRRDSKSDDPEFLPCNIYYIPENYILQRTDIAKNSQIDRWQNKEEYIKLYQSKIQTDVCIDYVNIEISTISIASIDISYYIKKEMYTIYWENDNIFFTLTCPVSLGWDEIEKIILNIQPADNPN